MAKLRVSVSIASAITYSRGKDKCKTAQMLPTDLPNDVKSYWSPGDFQSKGRCDVDSRHLHKHDLPDISHSINRQVTTTNLSTPVIPARKWPNPAPYRPNLTKRIAKLKLPAAGRWGISHHSKKEFHTHSRRITGTLTITVGIIQCFDRSTIPPSRNFSRRNRGQMTAKVDDKTRGQSTKA